MNSQEELNNKIQSRLIANLLHTNYEIFAKQEGWNTNKSCKDTSFNKLPEKNKQVMLKMGKLVYNYSQTRFQEGRSEAIKEVLEMIDEFKKEDYICNDCAGGDTLHIKIGKLKAKLKEAEEK